MISIRIPTAVNFGFLDRSRYFPIQVAPQLSSRGWDDPVPDPLFLRKSGSAGNRTRNLWICSEKLWPLDHRGGQKKIPSRQLSGLQTPEGGDAEKEVIEDTQDYNGKGVLFQPHHCRHVLRGSTPRQDRGTAAASDTSGGSGRSRHSGTQGPCGVTPTRTADSRPFVCIGT
jgi:hypothetical protein